MKSVDVISEINKIPSIELLNKHGVTRDDFAKCLKRGLEAKKDIRDRDGDIIDTVENFNVQHKFLALGLEWIKELNGPGTTIVMTQEKKDAVAALERWRGVSAG